MTEHFALVGSGIQHSLSTGLWNQVFAAIGRDADYTLRDVGDDGLDAVIGELRSGELAGVHVTMPHKEWAYRVVDSAADPAVEATGVVNSISPVDGRLVGINTDVLSARILLGELTWRPRTALVVGAGATASSLVCAVGGFVDEVLVTNRSPDRARRLADRPWEFPVRVVDWEHRGDQDAELVVNTAPFGLTTEDSPFDRWPASARAFYDLIYRPERTLLQTQAFDAGVVVVDGLAHLQGHAEATLERWGGGLGVGQLTEIMTRTAGRAPARWDRD